MDTHKVRELLAQLDDIRAQIAEATAAPANGGVSATTTVTQSKQRNCSNCGLPGHRSSTCTNPAKGTEALNEFKAQLEATNGYAAP